MVILGGSIGAVFIYGLQDMLLLVITRFTDIADDTSSVERWDMLSGGFIQFLKEPLLGSFLEERISREYPHNLVVESFMATGLVGGTLFVLYYVASIRSMAGVLFQTGLSFISLATLSVIILSLFSGGLSFSVDFWFNTAVINGIFFCYQKSIKTIQPPNLYDFSLAS
jgi:O-antigen ligase